LFRILTIIQIYAIYNSVFKMSTYSTKQVAKAVGINRVTLQRWLLSGKLPEPERLKAGGVDVRVWNDQDVERARRFKQANYRKGRGRKKTSKK
jgi:predicted DNA-binding transcriptional regulator AlpA